MIKKITFLTLFIISFSLFSQEKIKGNGIVSTIKTDVAAFKKIIINNNFKIVLIKSDTPSIEIETDENIHEHINFNVSDSTFILQTSEKLKPKKTLNITLFCTNNLNEITINDSAEIESLTTIKVPNMLLQVNDYAKTNLDIKASNFKLFSKNKSKIQLRTKSKLNIESTTAELLLKGSSNILTTIKADSLQINLKEKANLEISGSTDKLAITSTDNSDCKGKSLTVKEAIVITKGSSEISTNAFETLTIEASNKSKINIYGNPKIIIEKFTNSAKLYKKELVNK